MRYVLKHFTVQEFIPPSIYNKLGDVSIDLMRDEILIFCDALWDHLNLLRPGTHLIVNNWFTGGPYSARGFRTDDMTGAKLSEHKKGAAVDLSSMQWKPKDIRREIMANSAKFQTITRLEKYLDAAHKARGEEINWVHADCKELPAGVNRIREFVAQ